MEWTKDNTFKLIDELCQRRCLWDITCPNYKNRLVKRDNMHELACLFGVSDREVENKLHNIRSQFLREYNKSMLSKRTGSGREDLYIPKWYAYESLLFLKDVNKPHSSRSTIEVSHNYLLFTIVFNTLCFLYT